MRFTNNLEIDYKFWFMELLYRLITWKFIHVVDLGFIGVEGLDWRLCYKCEISYLWVSEFCIEEFGWTIDVVFMYLVSITQVLKYIFLLVCSADGYADLQNIHL